LSAPPASLRPFGCAGGKEVIACVSSARLYVCAHGKKRFVIALKYTGEEDYHY
jgi:hypothetical protein